MKTTALNPFSLYGSPFSNPSANNLFATDAPRLYDQAGHYRGKLSANPFDPESGTRSIHGGSWRNRAVALRNGCAEA